MFTGIVEEIGVVTRNDGGLMSIEAAKVLDSTVVGDSIALNGCCLTVTAMGKDWWSAEAVTETLRRTTLGSLSAGDRVNLERPCRADGRLGGHIVQGHVDAIGEVVATEPLLSVAFPGKLARYVVEKGSIALDGVSLTVVGVHGTPEAAELSVALIPHTREATVLGERSPGGKVNIEVDVLAKYVESLLAAQRTAD